LPAFITVEHYKTRFGTHDQQIKVQGWQNMATFLMSSPCNYSFAASLADETSYFGT